MTRQHVIFLLALIALVGSLLATWATVSERDYQLRGYVNPVQNPRLPFRVPRLGVNAELTQYTPEELNWHLDRMQAAHVTWVRHLFRWDDIEPQRGQYQWDRWDNVVNGVGQYPEFHLVAVLVNTPVWARLSPSATSPTTPPANVADFAEFAQAFAERYRRSIDFYQIWDEPNLTGAWGGLEPRPAEYAALLQASYTAIHAADEDASVIAAALAPTLERGPANLSDIAFLHDLYALGVGNYSDGIAAKPFGFDTSPYDRTVDSDVLNFSRIVALREEMVRNNDGATPLWASSVAWNSLPQDWSGTPSIWGSVTPEEQTKYTLGALDRADQEWPWLAGLILFHWQPEAEPDNPLWGFALIDHLNRPTAVWTALSERAVFPAAQNGLFAAINPYAQYSGIWRLGDFGADVGWLDDSQVSFDFAGEEVALLLRQGDYVAYLYPTIDGQQTNATPRDTAGNAYVLLTSNSRETELELVPVASGLNDERHLLHIVADRGQQQWPLVGFAVSSGDLSRPHNRQIAAALFTVMVAGVSSLVTGWQLDWTIIIRPVSGSWRRLSASRQIVISALTSVALMVGMVLTWGDHVPNLVKREGVQLGLAIVSGGLIYIQPGLALTIVAAVVLFVIFFNRPDIGLMLTIFWAPFYLFPVELYEFAFPMAEILIWLTASPWLLRLLGVWGRNRQSSASIRPPASLSTGTLLFHSVDYGVMLWLIVGVLSLSWSERIPQAVTELRVMIVEPTLFYLVLRSSVTDRLSMTRIVDAMLAGGFVVAVIGLWLFAQGEAIIAAEAGTLRLASVYGSPNNVALFLGRCIPFVLAYLILSTDRIRRLAAGGALAVMLLAVVLTQSVGGLFLGVPISMTVVFLLVWRRRSGLAIAALIAVLAATLPLILQSARFARLLDFSGGTNFFRIRVWQSAINMIRDHPLTGIGLDQFLYAFRGQYILPDAWQEPNLSHPHNIILDFWIRLGVLGVANFLWLQIAFWRAMRSVYRLFRGRDPLFLALSVGSMGSMVNLLGHGLVDNSVYVNDLCYVYVLLLGLAANLSNIRTIDESGEIMV